MLYVFCHNKKKLPKFRNPHLSLGYQEIVWTQEKKDNWAMGSRSQVKGPAVN